LLVKKKTKKKQKQKNNEQTNHKKQQKNTVPAAFHSKILTTQVQGQQESFVHTNFPSLPIPDRGEKRFKYN